MARTYFQDFTKDDGSPVTVEYGVEGSYSPTTYSPHSGACGGDAPVFSIIEVFPNTPEYRALWERKQAIETTPFGKPRSPLLMSTDDIEALTEIVRAIEKAEAACQLTDAERERMEAYLAEHYVEEDPEPEF